MLTALFHRKFAKAAFVRWLRNERGQGNFATGPIVEMTLEEWKANGWRFVRRHFKEYDEMLIPKQEMVPVFGKSEGPKYLKHLRPVTIEKLADGRIVLSPMEFRRLSLVELSPIENGIESSVSIESSSEDFQNAFDAVLAQVD